MTQSKIGNVRLMLQHQTDIDAAEKIRRGVKYSPPKKPSSERLILESLRDQALAARIERAAKRQNRSE